MPVATNFKDCYAILGIAKTATEEDIKVAYKTLALQWHPDRHTNRKEEAGRNFIQINEAYNLLMDKDRREWYDNLSATDVKGRGRTGRASHDGKPSAGGRPKVPTTPPRPKSWFGVGDSSPNPPSPQKDKPGIRSKSADNRDIEPDAGVQEFIRQMPKRENEANAKDPSLKSQKPTVYDASDSENSSHEIVGTRLHTTTVVTTGVPSEWIFPLPLTLEELSEGTTHRYRITRHLLSGKKKNIMVDIDVAPGWRKGTKIRFAGAGNERHDAAPQDIVFVVEEAPHERFVREGSTLVARVQISLVEALTGDGRTVFFSGLNGEDVEVRVPPSVVKHGDEYHIKGAGMPIRRQGKVVGRGDMIIQWEVVFPYRLFKQQVKDLRKVLRG